MYHALPVSVPCTLSFMLVEVIDNISYSFKTAPYPIKVLLPARSNAVFVEGAEAAIPEPEGTKLNVDVPPA